MTKSKIILVDMDGVIANFELGFLKIWKQTYPKEFFVPLKKRQTFAIVDDYPQKLRQKVIEIYHQPNFFANLPPIPGSLRAIKRLSANGWQVFICTSPILTNPDCIDEKYRWITNNLGQEWAKRLIITKDKTLILADLLIDDHPEITGVTKPKWRRIVFDQPYNQSLQGRRLVGWKNWPKFRL